MTVVDEVTDLLQHLIRNACVNDGTPEGRGADFTSMFHGDDERIDQESLVLGVQFFEAVARDFLD
ncbi:MAG TPA: hypothetical protein VG476_16740 [Acidimicrobiales bacterium]|nr:hypothetical protein [Acidimicrobiales bacterium]